MSDISKYLVTGKKQVLAYLKVLSAERCLISAAFGKGDKDTFLTAIMDINEKNETITIDCGPKEYLNKRLIGSAVIKCSTEFKGIKVFFEGRKVVKSGSASDPAFIIPLPRSIYWVQRRQYYRLKSPLSKHSYCTISFVDPETDEQHSVNLDLHDLSANGISLHNTSDELHNLLEPSATFDNCLLFLQDEPPISIDIEIRNISTNKPKIKGRIGCYITNSTPSTEAAILRYMQNIERELKQKSL